ncbi:unnamed protein product, partial [Adineta steineri]
MCNNVISLILLILLLTKSSDTFRLFSSDTGTYKEPRPFFTSSKKLIDDYYDGNLAQVSKTINSHTFVFVMYYASKLFSSDTGTYKEPRPFFTSSKKLIDDYYDGNLAQVSKTINSHTFVFVMYYANFCGISRRMRDPYEKAAAFYRER